MDISSFSLKPKIKSVDSHTGACDSVLVRVSIAVKRYHGHHNSCKAKHLIGADFQKVSPLLSWREEWQHSGRHGAGGAESFRS